MQYWKNTSGKCIYCPSYVRCECIWQDNNTTCVTGWFSSCCRPWENYRSVWTDPTAGMFPEPWGRKTNTPFRAVGLHSKQHNKCAGWSAGQRATLQDIGSIGQRLPQALLSWPESLQTTNQVNLNYYWCFIETCSLERELFWVGHPGEFSSLHGWWNIQPECKGSSTRDKLSITAGLLITFKRHPKKGWFIN